MMEDDGGIQWWFQCGQFEECEWWQEQGRQQEREEYEREQDDEQLG